VTDAGRRAADRIRAGRVKPPVPQDLPGRLLASRLGSLITRPWFDRVVLQVGLAAYIPLSRAWAAAAAAEGDLDRFVEQVPLRRVPPGTERGLLRTLRRIAELRADHDAMNIEWEHAFFGGPAVGAERLVMVERARRRASDTFMKGRLAFLPLRFRRVLPPVKYAIPRPHEVEARHGPRLANIAGAFLPPDPLPAILESRRIHGPHAVEYWLRYPSGDPAVGEAAWAHVFEPLGVKNPPSLVDGHGLAVEIESLDGVEDGVADLVRLGVRVIRIEAPWHNRRRPEGWYGGEPFLAGPPTSALDLFSAEVREMAMLVAWCRGNSRGRVAVGGTSLGALASQLVASHCGNWPVLYRPDAVFLGTTTEDVGGLSFDSSIAKLVGLPGTLRAAGWSPETFARWRPLTDPADIPALDPRDVIMVLGTADDVTPFPRGAALAKRWKIPPESLFLRPMGHFSAALDLIRDPLPLRRLAERLKRR
jgi:hypothetical protein